MNSLYYSLTPNGSTIESSIQNLRFELQKSKTQQKRYLLELNTLATLRSKISSSIEDLSTNYQKQIKSLQQKVKKLQSDNKKLQKKNSLYEMEIQNFQKRILEKDKIISNILAKDFVIGSGSHSIAKIKEQILIQDSKGTKSEKNILVKDQATHKQNYQQKNYEQSRGFVPKQQVQDFQEARDAFTQKPENFKQFFMPSELLQNHNNKPLSQQQSPKFGQAARLEQINQPEEEVHRIVQSVQDEKFEQSDGKNEIQQVKDRELDIEPMENQGFRNPFQLDDEVDVQFQQANEENNNKISGKNQQIQTQNWEQQQNQMEKDQFKLQTQVGYSKDQTDVFNFQSKIESQHHTEQVNYFQNNYVLSTQQKTTQNENTITQIEPLNDSHTQIEHKESILPKRTPPRPLTKKGQTLNRLAKPKPSKPRITQKYKQTNFYEQQQNQQTNQNPFMQPQQTPYQSNNHPTFPSESKNDQQTPNEFIQESVEKQQKKNSSKQKGYFENQSFQHQQQNQLQRRKQQEPLNTSHTQLNRSKRSKRQPPRAIKPMDVIDFNDKNTPQYTEGRQLSSTQQSNPLDFFNQNITQSVHLSHNHNSPIQLDQQQFNIDRDEHEMHGMVDESSIQQVEDTSMISSHPIFPEQSEVVVFGDKFHITDNKRKGSINQKKEIKHVPPPPPKKMSKKKAKRENVQMIDPEAFP